MELTVIIIIIIIIIINNNNNNNNIIINIIPSRVCTTNLYISISRSVYT